MLKVLIKSKTEWYKKDNKLVLYSGSGTCTCCSSLCEDPTVCPKPHKIIQKYTGYPTVEQWNKLADEVAKWPIVLIAEIGYGGTTGVKWDKKGCYDGLEPDNAGYTTEPKCDDDDDDAPIPPRPNPPACPGKQPPDPMGPDDDDDDDDDYNPNPVQVQYWVIGFCCYGASKNNKECEGSTPKEQCPDK